MSTLADAIQTIQTALDADHGTIDLTSRVRLGAFTTPPLTGAFASVFPTPASAQPYELRDMAVTTGADVMVWVPSGGQNASHRILAALNAATDLYRALWTALLGEPVAPFDDGKLYDLQLSWEVAEGAEIEKSWSAYGVVVLRIGYTLHSSEGVL